ncbi:Tab2/Atab2 family RNA-binding protein [cf. Phormidesmis sp. LEGE 11477]|uniref:Tab2/Atab2 family RNA-binding protein n=1 Tax=cf. Phormidesmis sp. LEGE 11477 TaxID=1828680 RepID=UPI001882012D|nr:Tab2/Atab2 family RNA-binding protein [cf. Phormidesmis sp. LEGE 11477]MBE9060551.1 Tab2/Atab2 family RNA-binding protein [cf. Phormidesmis sp. LEGE 11477]
MPWQLDFYRRPLKDSQGSPLWELLICDETLSFTYGEFCAQSQANAPWLRRQLEIAKGHAGSWPSHIEIFRPQAVSIVEVACRDLPVDVWPKRDVPVLKQWLQQRAAWYPNLDGYTKEAYEPIALERPAPVPVADHLMGEGWQFAAISIEELQRLSYEPIPIQSVAPELMPIHLGLPSTLLIPGVVIDGGRQSMMLAQWLQSADPVMLQYIAGVPDGLLLEAGLIDRWILATFEDEAVAAAARTFTERKIAANGLHFLLVRPDDSGLTYTGLWLLQSSSGKRVQRSSGES